MLTLVKVEDNIVVNPANIETIWVDGETNQVRITMISGDDFGLRLGVTLEQAVEMLTPKPPDLEFLQDGFLAVEDR